MWALVPLKLLAAAKQRLASEFTPEQRQQLVLAMASDVLAALHNSTTIDHILLISRNNEAIALAERVGAELLAESEGADLPGALREAVAYANSKEASGVCIVPADAPLVTAADIDLLVSQHRTCTVVPDAHCVGTNALVLTPPLLLAPIFDGQSFKPHVRAAVVSGIAVRILSTPGLALDIDTPADLDALRRSATDSFSKRFLSNTDDG